MLDAVGAGRVGEALEVLLALGMEGKTDEARLAQMGDMDVMRGAGAAHVERLRRALDAYQPEVSQEFLSKIKIRRLQPRECEIGDFHDGHGECLLGRYYARRAAGIMPA